MNTIKIRAVAIDDEPPALEVLKTYAERVPFLQLEATYNNPIAGYKAVEELKPDLLFLDIQMPEISGINMAEQLSRGQMIVFTTAHSRYAVEGFNLNAVDYLLKPFDFNRFLQAVNRVQEQLLLRQSSQKNENQSFILVKIDYQNVKIILNDILYIEGLDNYIKIYTTAKMYLTLMNLKGITSLLPSDEFIRIHKSFIIPLSKINHFTKEKVMVGKNSIPIGRSYANDFLETIKNRK